MTAVVDFAPRYSPTPVLAHDAECMTRRSRTVADPSSRTSREGSPKRKSMARAYDGSGIERCAEGVENIINALGALAELALLDRYERQALWRRKFTVRPLAEACAAARPFSNDFGP
jgi:hypothetical protein